MTTKEQPDDRFGASPMTGGGPKRAYAHAP